MSQLTAHDLLGDLGAISVIWAILIFISARMRDWPRAWQPCIKGTCTAMLLAVIWLTVYLVAEIDEFGASQQVVALPWTKTYLSLSAFLWPLAGAILLGEIVFLVLLWRPR